MSIVVIGLNNKCAPLDLLEQVSLRGADIDKAHDGLRQCDNVGEVVVLSTCHRTEVYAVAERFHGAYDDIRSFFADRAQTDLNDLADRLYVHYDDDAVRHLFGLASGIDSSVIGETEILGQVKNAWEVARVAGAAGPTLNMLFRHATVAGKRARTDTGISRNITSVSQAAVAIERLGTLAGRDALVVGAGDMATGMLESLASAKPASVVVANRTKERAIALAKRAEGRAIGLAELPAQLRTVDLLLTGTGASSMILDHADLAGAISDRNGRPLVIVDVAVPRDVDPQLGLIDGVTLLDMEDLSEFAQRGRSERLREIAAVDEIVLEEVQRFNDVRSAREVAPLITALHSEAEAIRQAELDRTNYQLRDLTTEQAEAVDALTKRIVAKMLYRPTVAIKDEAGSPKGDRLADSVRDLFGL
ncbi:MAG: glutamyl-tRNA reductase [Actinobacteria bacterium]|nr:glutamyl-tRNA reductase [Actinomycetota bacterium]